MTGSNLPPGCTSRHIDEAAGLYAICPVCAKYTDDCICPECPTCSTVGSPNCYIDLNSFGPHPHHNLTLSKEQKISRQHRRIANLKDELCEAQDYLEYLEEGDDR